jgi:glycosyltransferase involved in cell wall biosynthesis
MKFAMITTFFGAHSFGGDAAYVDRLSRALLKNGHEVDVIYSQDSFELLAKGHPPRNYDPPENLKLYPLQTRLKSLSQLLVHQTGTPGVYKKTISQLLMRKSYDVIHFHNISLIGGTGLFNLKTSNKNALKIMSAHEHWLQCPMSLLWQYDKQVCQQKKCIRCTLFGKRPPQLWRSIKQPAKAVKKLDALLCPSMHTRELYKKMDIPVYRLPYCLPEKWMQCEDHTNTFKNRTRPYFAVAGRLVSEKGFQNLIPVMKNFPQYDLLIAGTGPLENHLKAIAPKNVHFLGLLSEDELAPLFHHSIAVIMSSLFYETFGYVALEAFATRAPVILHNVGALPELVHTSGGGLIYNTNAELITAMSRLASDSKLRTDMAERGFQAWQNNWSEDIHCKMYISILDDLHTR